MALGRDYTEHHRLCALSFSDVRTRLLRITGHRPSAYSGRVDLRGHNAHYLIMRYSTTLKVRTEADLPDAIIAAAERKRLKGPEFVRQVLREAVRAAGIELPPGGNDEPPRFPPMPSTMQAPRSLLASSRRLLRDCDDVR